MGEAGVDNLRMQTIRVDHSGDMAMELGHFALLVRSTDGSVVTEQGKYVRVWRRVGAWLTIADCWSKTSQMAVDQVA
jgi:ketosteroid isomerase-like protein